MIKIYLTVIFFTFSGVVNAAAITSLEITGGSFDIGGAGGSLNPGAYADMTIGGYDGYIPVIAPVDEFSYTSSSIATFTFHLFGPAAILTSEADGVNSGFAPVTGDITDGNLTLDLSSWSIYWSGVLMNLGSSSDMAADSVCVDMGGVPNCTTAIMTTYDEMSGAFTASWDAVVVGGAFDGYLASWSIEGNVSTVPVPAAVWLFGSGLLGLAAVARRRKVV